MFSVDLRHVDSSALMALGDRIDPLCITHAGSCSVEVIELTRALSLDFPASMTRLVRDTAQRLGIASMDIYSAAGHDARFLHEVCPPGMIFVPCKDGISHNPQESATPQDLAASARVLAAALVELARR